MLGDEPLDLPHVLGGADEALGDIVHAVLQAQYQVIFVLVSKGRGPGGDVGQVDPLVLSQLASVNHATANVGGGDGQDLQLDLAVGQQYTVSLIYVSGQVLVGGGHDPGITYDVPGGDNHLGPGFQVHFAAILQGADAYLGPLEVLQDRQGHAQFLCTATEGGDGLDVLVWGAVGEVEPGHIHALLYKPLNHLLRVAGRAYGAYDLGLTHGVRLAGRVHRGE